MNQIKWAPDNFNQIMREEMHQEYGNTENQN